MSISQYNRYLEWVKSVLEAQLVERGDNMLELGYVVNSSCGSLHTWPDAKLGLYVGVDGSEAALDRGRVKAEGEDGQNHEHTWILADPCLASLEAKLPFTSPIDLVVSFGGFHKAFESKEKLKTFLGNVSRELRPGGYFMGTCLDPTDVWGKWQKLIEKKATGPGGLIKWTDKEKLFVLELGSVDSGEREDEDGDEENPEGEGEGSAASDKPKDSGKGNDGDEHEKMKLDFEGVKQKTKNTKKKESQAFSLRPFGTPFSLLLSGELDEETGYVPDIPTLIEYASSEGLRLISTVNMREFFETFQKHYQDKLESLSVLGKKRRIEGPTLGLIGCFCVFVMQKDTKNT